jgi:hypothetical protein
MPKKAKRILVSHQPSFLPVLKTLAAEGWEIITVDGAFAKTLSDLDLPVQQLGAFGQGLQDQATNAACHILYAAMTSLPDPHSLSPSVVKFAQESLPGFLYGRLPDLGLITMAMDTARPDIVMLHNDVEPLARLPALWARERGIPCLHVPHAIYQDVGRGQPGSDIHDLITASHLAAAGPFQAEWYAMRGFPPENIFITGLPQLDEWARFKPDRAKARARLHLDKRPVVVYASTWPQATNAQGVHDEWALCYLAFLEAVKGLDVQVVVKLHPRGGNENFSWHAQKANEWGVKGIMTAIHNQLIMSAADVVLAYAGSNLLLEAAHIPGLRLLTTAGYDDDPEIGRVDKIEPVSIGKAISESLAVAAPDMGRLLTKYHGPHDGRAGERVVELVKGLTR